MKGKLETCCMKGKKGNFARIWLNVTPMKGYGIRNIFLLLMFGRVCTKMKILSDFLLSVVSKDFLQEFNPLQNDLIKSWT